MKDHGAAAKDAQSATSSEVAGARSDVHVAHAGRDEPYPTDWPGPGPIDLDVHDLPHASSTLEWWYQNGHITTTDGRHLSFFAAFFRQAKSKDKTTGAHEYALHIDLRGRSPTRIGRSTST